MPVDQQKDLERTPISTPESLRVRCPHCRKLYLVQYNDIQESKPRFECVECRDRFWISLNDMDFSTEVDGLPIHVKESPKSAPAKVKETDAGDPCPKCFKLTPRHSSECVHCGVVLKKVRELEFKEPVPAHSPHLEALWHQVISAYDVPNGHDEFIRACQADSNLAYAAVLYGQMSKIMPMDEITTARLKQVKALSDLLTPGPARPRIFWRQSSRLWQIPLLAGVICLAVGLALPVFRNIAGVGAAFLFLAVAMRGR